jgi:radical SAM protein with 4Fe4S-binding SPASM domain
MQDHNAHQQQERNRIGIDDYKKLLDEVAGWNPVIQMTGGEPFMYREIDALIETVKERNLFCMINTNGTMLKKHAELIVDLGVEKITVSIEGPPEIHNQICNFDKAYDLALSGIQAIVEEKKKRRSSYPFIDVKSVITPANVGQLESVVKLLDKGWIQMVDFVHMWFLHKSQVEIHEKLNTGVDYYIPHNFPLFAQDELKSATKHVRELQHRYSHFPFIVFPDIPDDLMQFYYSKPVKRLYRNRCIYPYETARILPNGDVLACPEDIAAKAILGNLRDRSLTEIIRGEEAQEFLRKLDKADGVWPICTRCCGLFRS